MERLYGPLPGKGEGGANARRWILSYEALRDFTPHVPPTTESGLSQPIALLIHSSISEPASPGPRRV